MATGDLITQKEAAAILNRSVSAVSRALRDGRLEYIDSERRLLHRPGLEARFRQTTRPRIDAPQRKAQRVTPDRPEVLAGGNPRREISTDYWQRLQDKLSVVLDGAPFYWAREPNPAQLRLFCWTLDELRSQVEAEGLEP
ncbi:hypothetical protein SynRS9907_01354 [Synechococcus sp. RS9907]|uniref:hypothetical protein n=1 Tax=Synechococcus sp. RS9907 TaxID=221350 RepID=UPI00165D7392|nr:hypothetical protein [Synechococcus sp. RS9907]QNI82198.1 hypothetical protein SynRS9907_01354 [Synechococcus sp. RS9907]